MEPGESVGRTFYVKNTGDAPITLSMATSGWNPAVADGSISIVWDREGVSLNPGLSISATLTLVASATSYSVSGITNFGVNIIITGSG